MAQGTSKNLRARKEELVRHYEVVGRSARLCLGHTEWMTHHGMTEAPAAANRGSAHVYVSVFVRSCMRFCVCVCVCVFLCVCCRSECRNHSSGPHK